MLEIYLRLPGRQGKDHHRGIGISRIHSDVGAVSVCAEGSAMVPVVRTVFVVL